MTARRARAARPPRHGAALAVLLLAAAGCGRGPEPVAVESVRIASGALAEPLRAAGLGDADLLRAASGALSRAGFRVGRGGARSYRARLDVLAVRTGPTAAGAPRLEVGLELELVPIDAAGDPVREAGQASRAFGAEGAAAAWRHAIEAAADRAAEGLAIAFAADGKASDALALDLAHPDPRIRAQAVRVLGMRREARAVPLLVARLDDAHPEVVERAVAALARMGDRRAVEPLIDLARRREPAAAARLAAVIGQLGGEEAEAYLLTVASGDPDPRVRRAAREALAAMEASPAGGGAPTAAPPAPAVRR